MNQKTSMFRIEGRYRWHSPLKSQTRFKPHNHARIDLTYPRKQYWILKARAVWGN